MRRTHNGGVKHKDNVRLYYEDWYKNNFEAIVAAGPSLSVTCSSHLHRRPDPAHHAIRAVQHQFANLAPRVSLTVAQREVVFEAGVVRAALGAARAARVVLEAAAAVCGCAGLRALTGTGFGDRRGPY